MWLWRGWFVVDHALVHLSGLETFFSSWTHSNLSLLDPWVVGGGASLDGLLGLPGLDGLAPLPPTIWRSASRRRQEALLVPGRLGTKSVAAFSTFHISSPFLHLSLSQIVSNLLSKWLHICFPVFCASFSSICQLLIRKTYRKANLGATAAAEQELEQIKKIKKTGFVTFLDRVKGKLGVPS